MSTTLAIGKDPVTGKRRQKSEAIRGTRKAAEAKPARIVHELETGQFAELSSITLADFLRTWLSDYAESNVASRTFEKYESQVRNHLIPILGNLRLRDLKPTHILAALERWRTQGRKYGAGGLSPRSCLHNYRVLHSALNQAVKWQLIPRNPANSVDAPRVKREEVETFDEEQISNLLRAAGDCQIASIIFVAVMTRLRRSELLGLRWDDLDLNTKTLHVQQSVYRSNKGEFVFGSPKTASSRRSVALADSVANELKGQRARVAKRKLSRGLNYDDNNLVFPARDGQPLDQNNLYRQWRDVLKRANLHQFKFHTLRHTCASLLLKAGAHPKVVQELLGHSSISVTMDTYSHLMPNMQIDAVNSLERLLLASAS